MACKWVAGIVRRLALVALITMTAPLSFEAGANLLYWLETKTFYLGKHFGDKITSDADSLVLKLHPYFGFMLTYSKSEMAKRGLIQNNFNIPQVGVYIEHVHDCCDFPIVGEKHRDQYLIALLGDSIGHGLGEYFQVSIAQNQDPMLQARLQQIPAATGKQVVILNLALGGHHPPQQLLTLAYLLAGGSKFDIILYYPSAQALISSRANEVSGRLIPDYPDWYVWTSMTRALEQSAAGDAASLLGLYGLHSSQRTQARLERCHIASCIMVNRPLLKFQRFLAEALAPQEDPNAPPPHFIDFRPVTPPPEGPERYAGYAESWKRNCQMMAALARQSGAEYLQILLPSPWTHSGGTAAIAGAAGPRGEIATETPPALAAMVKASAELRQAGIRALDATHVLDNANLETDPQVFLDAVGHMGHTGLKTVVDYSVDHLIDPGLQ